MTSEPSAIVPSLVFDQVTVGSGSSSRDGSPALDNVTFVVERGEAVGLLGARDGERDALRRVATGEARSSEGDVWVRDQPALITKSTAFPQDTTLESNMDRILRVSGMRGSGLKSALLDIAAQCSAEEQLGATVADADPATVDRVRLACLLRLQPSLLIVDDPRFRMARTGGVGQTLLQEHLDRGGSVLMTSDDPGTLIRTCSRILWLDGGRLLGDGPSRVVARDFRNLADAREAGDRKRAGQLRRRHAADYQPLTLLPHETGRRTASIRVD